MGNIFKGATTVNQVTVEKALKSYEYQKKYVDNLIKEEIENLKKRLPPLNAFWRLFYKDSYQKLLSNMRMFEGELYYLAINKYLQFSEDQMEEVRVVRYKRTLDYMWEEEYWQLYNLSYSSSDIYVTPEQMRFISIFRGIYEKKVNEIE